MHTFAQLMELDDNTEDLLDRVELIEVIDPDNHFTLREILAAIWHVAYLRIDPEAAHDRILLGRRIRAAIASKEYVVTCRPGCTSCEDQDCRFYWAATFESWGYPIWPRCILT
jgi:hypothetical protein